MFRSFVFLLAVSPGFALGCSDPVPAAVAVGLRLNLAQSGTCPVTAGINDDLGNPPPYATVTGKGNPVYDGNGGVEAACTVSGAGPFNVTADVRAPGVVALTISNANLAANGTGMATMGFNSAAIGGSVSSSSCSITAVPTEAGPGIKPGAIWATFNCSNLLQSGTPNINCSALGEFLLENCKQ